MGNYDNLPDGADKASSRQLTRNTSYYLRIRYHADGTHRNVEAHPKSYLPTLKGGGRASIISRILVMLTHFIIKG